MSKCPFSVFFSKKNRVEEVKPSIVHDETDAPFLRVRRLHPTQGIKIVPANSRLIGPDGQNETKDLPRSKAVSQCGPYIHANSLGWWIFPPTDLDAEYHGNGNWSVVEHNKYNEQEHIDYLSKLKSYEYKTEDGSTQEYSPILRTYVESNAADEHLLQIWTGVILRTPPGWGLLVRSPINAEEDYDRPWHVQEGVIESDWMDYDLWINLVFTRKNERVEIRQNMWPPLAQIVPIRREAYEKKWEIDDKLITDDDPEWASWQDYNFKKWERSNEMDGKTYYKERSVQKPRKDSSKIESLREKYISDRNEHQIKKS